MAMAGSNISDKSRGIALALATVIGPFGGHRFYVGKIGTGLLQLATLGGLGVWWLYDWILVLAGGFRDVEGRRLAYWGEDEERRGQPGMDNEKLEILLDEIDRLRSEMGELDERMDFMERMLSDARHRGAIPPPGSP
jgi:hypothetical protein